MVKLKVLAALTSTLMWSTAYAQQCGTVSNCPPASTPLSGSETLYVIQGGVSKRTTVANVAGTSPGFGVTTFNSRSGAVSLLYQDIVNALAPFPLPIVAGGTGQSTSIGAFNALSPITSSGDLIVGNGANSATKLTIGPAGTVLTSNGSAISWQAPSPVASIINGSTPIIGGTPNGLLFNNNNFFGNLATANNGLLVTNGSGVPSIATNPILTAQTVNAAALSFAQSSLTPAQSNGIQGSVGYGAEYITWTRSGGYGEYGHVLVSGLITAATPTGQFDVASTAWLSHTNLTGGQLFGGWTGANTPASNLSQTYTSGAAIGHEINYGNRWADFGLQTALGVTRYTVGLQIVPDVLPAPDGVNTVPVTMTCASPSVFTLTNHGYSNNMGLVLGGTPCTGFTSGSTYYVVNKTTNTFQLSASINGTAINGSGSSSSVTALPSYPGSFGLVLAPSVHGHQTWIGTFTSSDSIATGGYNHFDYGGSTFGGSTPAYWTSVQGYWGTGLDLSASNFSTFIAVKMNQFDGIVGGYYQGTNTSASTSTNTGSATFAGGIGVAGATYTATLNVASIPTSAGSGGLYVCVDTAGNTYKKASCP